MPFARASTAASASRPVPPTACSAKKWTPAWPRLSDACGGGRPSRRHRDLHAPSRPLPRLPRLRDRVPGRRAVRLTARDRARRHRRHGARPLRRRLLEAVLFGVFPYPHRLAIVLGLLRRYRRWGLQALVRRSGLLRRFPRLAAMDALLQDVPRTDAALPEFLAARGRARGRVALLTGCVQRHLSPTSTATRCACCRWRAGRRGAAWTGLLRRAGAARGTSRGVSRAGAGAGRGISGGRRLGRHQRRRLRLGVTRLRPLGRRGRGRRARGRPDARRHELLAGADLPLGSLPLTATYHDPCHLAHGQRVRSAPRALLGRIPDLRLVPLADSELCCGSAGVFNIVEPEMADRLLALKIARITETGARTVVTGNPGASCRSRAAPASVASIWPSCIR